MYRVLRACRRAAARAPTAAALAPARHASGMGMSDRFLRLMYYEPVFADVTDKRGVQNLIAVESHKRAVVLVYHKAKDGLVRECVQAVAGEVALSEVNNKVLYAFASATLDETLPCAPVMDIWVRGKLVQRTLGRSPSALRGGLPYFVHRGKFEGAPDAVEAYPTETLFGISGKPGSLNAMVSRLANAPLAEMSYTLQKERREHFDEAVFEKSLK